MDRDLELLMLRNAIADKEAAIAVANMEREFRDGWSCNWESVMQEADQRARSHWIKLQREGE